MTAGTANAVSDRFHSIMFSHQDALMADFGGVDCMADMLEGRKCSIVIRQRKTLIMFYVPRHSVQFLFDAYG